MPMRRFQAALLDHVRDTFPQLAAPPPEMLTTPPDPALGDLALQAFPLARLLRQGPPQIAAALATGAVSIPGVARVEQQGPYLNFFLDLPTLAAQVLEQIRREGDNYGAVDLGRGQTVVLDYSSPNIAKPFGIGHLRSTVIGGALCRLYRAAGYRVVGINHLGDWGTQFGLLLAALEDASDEAALEADPVEYCYRLYVDYSARREAEATIGDRARQWFKRLEQGDPVAGARWSRLRELSLREFDRIYRRLGVSFDHVRGESYYNDLMPATLERLRAAGLLREDDGAQIVDLSDEQMPPALLIKSDGASTYLLRDLAAAESRAEEFGFARCLYVIGSPQALHIRQMRAVLHQLGYRWAEGVAHVGFGHITGMRTREGNLIYLEEVLREAAERSRAKLEENQARGWTEDTVDAAAVAEAVGIGAIVFNDLKQNRIHDISFDWERMLSLDGDSGPYLQYAYSRTCGILRKGGSEAMPEFDPACFADGSAPDKGLLIALGSLSLAIERAVTEDAPHHLCQYLLDVASQFSRWYTTHQVLGSGPWERPRLALVHAVRGVLAVGLRLLGLTALERM